MADLIGELPETAVSNFEDGPASSGRVELVDSNDQTIYQWGPFERPMDLKPFVEVPVSAPLSSWRLKYYLADDNLVTEPGRSAYFNLVAALTVIGIWPCRPGNLLCSSILERNARVTTASELCESGFP